MKFLPNGGLPLHVDLAELFYWENLTAAATVFSLERVSSPRKESSFPQKGIFLPWSYKASCPLHGGNCAGRSQNSVFRLSTLFSIQYYISGVLINRLSKKKKAWFAAFANFISHQCSVFPPWSISGYHWFNNQHTKWQQL